MSRQEMLQAQNTAAIQKALQSLNEEITYDTVSKIMPAMLARGELVLDPAAYTPGNIDAKCPGRYLVYDHQDSANAFSVWAFAFAPQQKTSIHSHKYQGTVVVLQGPLSEKAYVPTEDGKAALIGRSDRLAFHTTQDDLANTPEIVHRLKLRKGIVEKEGTMVAVSLHIYNMAAFKVEAAQKEPKDHNDHNRNLFKLFDKATKPAGTVNPPYEVLRV